jgi:hypothetical protein
MTWPDGIAAVALIVFALLITRHQHRSTTQPHHTRRTENGHDHQNTQGQHREENAP